MRPLATLGLALALLGASAAARAGTVSLEPQGGRNVRVFVPTTPQKPTPLLVMLHGCTQTADAFADATQMDAVAEKNGFVVAYPEQSADTISTRCFRWYEPAHQARDAGEPKELADAAAAIAAAHGVDPERVYVAGLSAGAAMSVVLGATYPDRFTAIGVIAGVEYKGASSLAGTFAAAQSGGPDPAQQGDAARAAMGPRARVVPTLVMHGTVDGILAPVNGDQVAAQWLRTNTLVLGNGAIDAAVTVSGTAGYPFTRAISRSKANGASVVEHYVIDGLGHAWPGGKAGASYSDASGPDASALLWAFFAGRTRTAPLDVPPVPVPPKGPGTAGDGGSGTGSNGQPGDPTSAAAPSEGSNGGGCALAPLGRRERAGGELPVALLALGLLLARRRAPTG